MATMDYKIEIHILKYHPRYVRKNMLHTKNNKIKDIRRIFSL